MGALSSAVVTQRIKQGTKRPFINGVYALEAILIYKAADRVLKYGRQLINDGAILFF